MAPVLRPLVGDLSQQASRFCCDNRFCRHSLQCPLRFESPEIYGSHSKKMEDEYVKIFLWQNQVAHLPDVVYEPTKGSVAKVIPILGRIVKSVLTSAFHPFGLFRYLLERNIRDACVYLVQRFYL